MNSATRLTATLVFLSMVFAATTFARPSLLTGSTGTITVTIKGMEMYRENGATSLAQVYINVASGTYAGDWAVQITEDAHGKNMLALVLSRISQGGAVSMYVNSTGWITEIWWQD